MSATPGITVEVARRALEVVDAGLSNGLGSPEPGKMCVEAAICYALGLPHGDDPGCVEPAIRSFKISLNDKPWSSNEARAKGLRALAVAQLGSKGVVDGREFTKRLAEATIRVIVPIAFRAAAQRVPAHATALEAAALECEREGTRESALKAKAYAAAAYAAAAAAAAAAYAADAAAAAAYADAYAADAAAAAYARDSVLATSASLALDVLREMGAPGVALWDEVSA